MSDPQQHDVSTRLDIIQHDVTELKTMISRVVIGEDGQGLLDRQARTEERVGSLRIAVGWLWAFVLLMACALVHLVYGKPQ
jgi:hypothetical protein